MARAIARDRSRSDSYDPQRQSPSDEPALPASIFSRGPLEESPRILDLGNGRETVVPALHRLIDQTDATV